MIQDFQEGAPTLHFAIFFKNTWWNWEKLFCEEAGVKTDGVLWNSPKMEGKFSEFRESDKSLYHEFWFEDPLCYICLADCVVTPWSLT